MNRTLQDVIELSGRDVLDHLARDMEISRLAGLQIQGDVAIVPTRAGVDLGELVPREGIPVVRGEVGGHTHLLIADGEVRWRPVEQRAAGLDLGIVTVGENAEAYMQHEEHGAMGLAPGSYMLRRQREQADEIRRVQD